MDSTPLAGWGLRHVEASDAAALNAYFATLAEPLSDYTFSQIFTWRNTLRLLWRELHGHLCVFANGAGDLTLLLPPIGYGDAPRALSAAFELMDDYNAQHHVPDRSRVEYASEDLLMRLDPSRSRLRAESMGHDYLYDTNRMIDLAGGDLASKRQAKNRFIRNYGHRVETYDASRHLAACMELLRSWNAHQSEHHLDAPSTNAIKRQKELLATELALQHAAALGLTGMVVHVVGDDGVERLGGFTLGERLGRDQSSIVIEKTDLRLKGLAQFIFSEFVRQHWSDRDAPDPLRCYTAGPKLRHARGGRSRSHAQRLARAARRRETRRAACDEGTGVAAHRAGTRRSRSARSAPWRRDRPGARSARRVLPFV